MAGRRPADAQAWTLARIKTLIGRRFHRTLTLSAIARMLRRHGGGASMSFVKRVGGSSARRRCRRGAWRTGR
nr:winged helix-turn-helix domain-containing protein [Streptomyces sp. NRRL F-2305]